VGAGFAGFLGFVAAGAFLEFLLVVGAHDEGGGEEGGDGEDAEYFFHGMDSGC